MLRSRHAGLHAVAAARAIVLAFAAANIAAAANVAHTVTIDGFAFKPPVLTVKVGETVEWRNSDPVPHTVTAKDAGLDSHDIAAGATFRFAPKKKGRIDYICTLHPSVMKGTLIVE